MKARDFLLALVALLLVLPAATAAMAADQLFEIGVGATGTLSVDVEGHLGGFGVFAPGDTTHERGFGMGITNLNSGAGFTVTVDGTDLQAFSECSDTDEDGNCDAYTAVPGVTIPESAIYVHGGTMGWDDQGGTIPNPITYPAELDGSPIWMQLGPTAQTIITGDASAYGNFWLDSPNPGVQVVVPGDATPGYQYYATLTYTIAGS